MARSCGCFHIYVPILLPRSRIATSYRSRHHLGRTAWRHTAAGTRRRRGAPIARTSWPVPWKHKTAKKGERISRPVPLSSLSAFRFRTRKHYNHQTRRRHGRFVHVHGSAAIDVPQLPKYQAPVQAQPRAVAAAACACRRPVKSRSPLRRPCVSYSVRAGFFSEAR
jgi:hypothetical protein